jgi:hypothetical protein
LIFEKYPLDIQAEKRRDFPVRVNRGYLFVAMGRRTEQEKRE